MKTGFSSLASIGRRLSKTALALATALGILSLTASAQTAPAETSFSSRLERVRAAADVAVKTASPESDAALPDWCNWQNCWNNWSNWRDWNNWNNWHNWSNWGNCWGNW